MLHVVLYMQLNIPWLILPSQIALALGSVPGVCTVCRYNSYTCNFIDDVTAAGVTTSESSICRFTAVAMNEKVDLICASCKARRAGRMRRG